MTVELACPKSVNRLGGWCVVLTEGSEGSDGPDEWGYRLLRREIFNDTNLIKDILVLWNVFACPEQSRM
jgi:hypothetical protein